MHNSSAYVGPLRAEYDACRALVGTTFVSGPDPAVEPPGAVEFRQESLLAAEPDDVFDFCLRMDNFASLMPDRITPVWGSSRTGELGGTYVFRWYLKNLLPITWAAFVDDFQPGREFTDLQVRGVFRHFRHTHRCVPEAGGTRYTDVIRFATVLGPRLDRVVVRRQLADVFRYRHRRMHEQLDRAAS